LSTSLAADLWLTEADPGQIENAVLNRLDGRPPSGMASGVDRKTFNTTLEPAAVPGLAPGDYVVLSVSDPAPAFRRR
jgi:hypothetical protein